jgi:hypothetical protein
MAIDIFPVPVTSSGPNAKTIVATAADTLYEGKSSFAVGVYKIDCAAGVVSNVEFLSDAGTVQTLATTVSGTVTVSVLTACDRIRAYTDTGTNTNITIELIASTLPDSMATFGNIVTLTNTQTYAGTSTSGYAYAVIVGAGGGGAGGASQGSGWGGGGGSGGVAKGLVALTGNLSVTIGTAGTGGYRANGNTGGATTVGNITANGGGGGNTNVYYGGAGIAGTPGGGNGGNVHGNGQLSTKVYQFVKLGTTGGGAGMNTGSGTTNSGGGSGIGTGGNNPNSNNNGHNGGNATGYGGGGGGGGGNNSANDYNFSGGSGSAGVVYLMPF